jgi:trimethylamine--corrinoid protein Co-methyltransferase
VDFPDLVFCDECMAGIRRMARNLVIDEKSLALETLKEVGPGGTFLTHTHTFENFRRELWMPKLLERRNWESWEKDGGLDIVKIAEKKVLDMMAAKPDKLLSAETEDQIDEIVIKAQNMG